MQLTNRSLSFNSYIKFWDVLSVINLVPASLSFEKFVTRQSLWFFLFVAIWERHGSLNADVRATSELDALDQIGLTEENMI